MQNIFVFILAISALGLAQEDKAPRFSIGLGVLAPSYSQKFDGNGRLDVDQNKNGFSYTLNNVPHSGSGSSSSSYQSQTNPQQSHHSSQSSGSAYGQPQPHFSIYSHRQIPKHSEATQYNSPQEDDGQYNAPEQHSPQSQSHQYQPNVQLQHNSQPSNEQNFDDGSYKGEEYYSQDHQKGGPQGQPIFAPYNFEQNIEHQYQNQQPFQSQPHQQPAQHSPNTYQTQPSQPRPIQMKSVPIQARHLPQRQQLHHNSRTQYPLRV